MYLNDKEIEILKIIENNGRIDTKDLAKMIGLSQEELEGTLKKLEERNIIVRYMTIINWSKVDDHEGVTAMIDVKVTPKRGVGFDDIAKRIYQFKEVQSVYLMSGAYDLSVIIEGKSMNEVARFVSDKLSTLDSVLSTTTHFILKKYKHDGIVFEQNDEDKRIVVSP
ncbi:Lrp/AsnC family transcriptional regulator [Peribacillus tepidiphilus]|jgi:DNA-binding Lrp family transcriptional regulator|uniref:Lrp/AsnC family transcriptional regulator n=1 Tax=Peribacillus tepidiphilus TaxID=2652445 RepID=UPI00129181B7|nr:Lrp/AsnC family transcriptional regulator [Peribacillus tepidiphilus]